MLFEFFLRCLRIICPMVLLFGCTSVEQKAVDNSQTVRVMSLSPAVTELLMEVCAHEQIVGRSHMCDYPASVASIPAVTTYPVLDLEKVVSIHPDIIFTNEGMTSPDMIERLKKLGVKVVVLYTNSLDEWLSSLDTIGKYTGNQDRATAVKDSLKQLMVVAKSTNSLKVLALVTIDPVFVHGSQSLLSDMIHHLGHVNVCEGVVKGAYPKLNREQLLLMNPDIVVGRTFEEMDSTFFRLYPELKRWPAYTHKRCVRLDEDLISRPGIRVPQCVKQLHDKLQ